MESAALVDRSVTPPAIRFPTPYNAATEFIDQHVSAGRSRKTALIDANGAHSFATLIERCNRAGNALLDLGLQPEQRVLLCMQDSLDLAAAFWGAIKAGLIPVPLNTLLTTEDYRYLVSDSRARAVVLSPDTYERFEPLRADINPLIVSGLDTATALNFDALLQAASAELEPAPTGQTTWRSGSTPPAPPGVRKAPCICTGICSSRQSTTPSRCWR